jgi:glycogen debranching enzyme
MNAKQLSLLLLLLILGACKTTEKGLLYQSKVFSLYKDKVVQGQNVATVLSPTHLKSNYKSPASETFSRLITFKFSINEKDNEMRPGSDHWLVIGNEHESPVMTFGATPPPKPDKPNTYLPVNYEYTFKIDMSPVLKQFEEKGYYEAFDGSKIAKADFKGFYIAGGSEPLTWDFVNLGNRGLKLNNTAGSNIYSITLKLNPYKAEDHQDKEWQLATDISKRPQYSSDQPIVDALFNLSLEEATKNIEKDSTFRTGAKWGGVWTRDISYSILLAFAYHQPDVAKISLMKKVKRGRIIQDTGSGGAWPVSSDRTAWALAAWEIYKVTGDKSWLTQAFSIIKNTVEDDYKTIYDASTGMYSGESSFLDWREQTYPKWMSNMDIYVSENLGTNVVHYQTHKILAEMATILGEPSAVYEARAAQIKQGINQYLWMADKGYYGQYLYGRPNLTLSPRFEALGEAFSILFDVADADKASSILSKSPVTDFGVTCIFPQIPGIPPYHNNAVWPFVQSYWNLAAAKSGNEQALNHGLAALYRAGGLFLTNYENFVAQSGDFLGTEINSDRMLWSMAGNLAMVHRVFMGMNFEANGLRFHPAIPHAYSGKKSLTHFKYRNALLNISVNGFGNQIKTILLDGKPLPDAFLSASVVGTHTIEIEMANNTFSQNAFNLVANAFTLPNPQAKKVGNTLQWDAIEGATAYRIYKNGKLETQTTTPQYAVSMDTNAPQFAEYKVSALDKNNAESFTSEPVVFTKNEAVSVVEFEDFAPKSALPYTNFSGKGFVEISTEQNRSIEVKVNVAETGEYLLDLHYSNGNGPWNTDNKCAIRSLYANGQYLGAMVLPQRGSDEWSDWGFSNARKVRLNKGENTLKLAFENWNNNMNVDVNAAMLDYLRLIKQ